MTTHPLRPAPSAQRGLVDGARAVPLIVLAMLALDALTTVVGQAYGISDLGRSSLLAEGQRLLLVCAAAATMWHRPRLAVVLSAVVVLLVFTVGVTGEELWLLVITGVAAGTQADLRQLGLVVLAQAGYATGIGLQVERTYPGSGRTAAVTMMAFAAAAVVVGLVARRLFRARDLRRARVEQLEREQAEIRAVERARLATELQEVVLRGLASIENELDGTTRYPAGVAALRSTLDRVDAGSRALLTRLRALLDILRRDPDSPVAAPSAPEVAAPRRWVDLLTARHVRIAATAVFGLLAARAAVTGGGSLPDGQLLGQVAGLLAWALAVWRPVAAAGCAVAMLALSILLGAPGHADLLSSTLLCLVAALRFRPRTFGVVVLGVVGYAGLLLTTPGDDPVSHLLWVGLTGLLAVIAGLTARQLVAARDESDGQLAELARQRDRLESGERGAVARELHDVVAHSLSVITLLVLGTSRCDDRTTLADTVAQVRRSTDAARHELTTLLFVLRGRDAACARDGDSLLTPLLTAPALARRLSDSGHLPAVAVDPGVETLDSTTQRTLSRILQEATTNILRYAPTGSPCELRVEVEDEQVRLRVASPLGGTRRSSDLSLGWGLRGIRERVELTGGTFTAGPDRGQWVLAVSLPTDGPAAAEPAALLVPAGASKPALVGEDLDRNNTA